MKRAGVVVFALAAAARVGSAQPSEPPPAPESPSPTPTPTPTPAPTPTETVTPALVAPVAPAAPVPSTPAFVLPTSHRLQLELELFLDADWISRAGPDLTEFVLDRGEAGTTIGLGHHAGAELRVESIRSAEDGGALGIDGDSIVLRVKRAQVFGDVEVGELRLDAWAGLVADPWITSLELDDTTRPLSATASERLLGWDVSDLAGVGRASYGPARLTVSFGNGEGLQYPERNTGKTTTAVLEIVPVVTQVMHAPLRLRLAVVGRDGSIGPASVRDRRVGGGATLQSAPVNAGVEVVRAYGLAERGDLVSTALAGWVEARPVPQAVLGLRGATLAFDGGGRRTTWGGAVGYEPWTDGKRGRLRLWLALDRTTSTGNAEALPGADPGDATTLMLIASTTAPFSFD